MLEIVPKYQHTKIGQFLFNITARFTQFVVKHKWIYYLLSCTWGIILTLVGIIITPFACLIFWKAPEVYHWVYCIKIGEYWGGFETGLMFIRDTTSSNSINQHEFGHTFQNCVFGPFTLFLVTIPSAIRYWYRDISKKKDTPYDAIWFEDSASQCGKWIDQYLKQQQTKEK